MAQVSEGSITLRLDTLSIIKDGYHGLVYVEVSIDEARELFMLLKERFEIYTPVQYQPVVRTSDNCWEPFPIRYTGINEDKNKVSDGVKE